MEAVPLSEKYLVLPDIEIRSKCPRCGKNAIDELVIKEPFLNLETLIYFMCWSENGEDDFCGEEWEESVILRIVVESIGSNCQVVVK